MIHTALTAKKHCGEILTTESYVSCLVFGDLSVQYPSDPSERARLAQTVRKHIGVSQHPAACLCVSGSEKTEMNNSRSSQSHQVNGSFPCSVGGGFNVCVCVCVVWDEITVWCERGEKAQTKTGICCPSPLTGCPWGRSLSVWQTECEAACTTKVSVSVRSGHHHVRLMSLTLTWTHWQGDVWEETLMAADLKMTCIFMLSVKPSLLYITY